MSLQYEIVSPAGEAPPEEASRQAVGAPPLADLRGRKIGLIWTVFVNGHFILDAFAELLRRRYPDIDFVKVMPGRDLRWGEHPDPSLTGLVRESGIDAAIVAAGC